MLKVKFLSLAAALLLPFAVNAQPAAQDWEVTLGGSGSFQSDFKGGTDRNTGKHVSGGDFGANLGLGYFINDNVDVSVRQALRYGTGGTWTGATRGAVDY